MPCLWSFKYGNHTQQNTDMLTQNMGTLGFQDRCHSKMKRFLMIVLDWDITCPNKTLIHILHTVIFTQRSVSRFAWWNSWVSGSHSKARLTTKPNLWKRESNTKQLWSLWKQQLLTTTPWPPSDSSQVVRRKRRTWDGNRAMKNMRVYITYICMCRDRTNILDT